MSDRHVLDGRFDELQTMLANLGSNLLAVEQSPTRQLLAEMRPVGATAVEWEACERTLAELFIDRAAVTAALTAARRYRDTKHLSKADQTEYERLVRGSVVTRERRRGPATERDMLEASTLVERSTISEAFERMRPEFARVRRLIAAVEARLDRVVPTVRDALADIAAVRRSVVAADGDVWEPDLAAIERSLGEAAELVSADPLSVDVDSVADLAERAANCRRAVEATPDTIAAWSAEFAALGTHLARLAASGDSIRELDDTVASRIAGVRPAPLDAEMLEQLTARWSEAQACAVSGSWHRAMSQCALIRAEAEHVEQRLRQRRTELDALLERRRELRGRLGAYQAKAERLRLLEDSEVDHALGLAEAALATAPVDLDAADALLVDLATALSPSSRRP